MLPWSAALIPPPPELPGPLIRHVRYMPVEAVPPAPLAFDAFPVLWPLAPDARVERPESEIQVDGAAAEHKLVDIQAELRRQASDEERLDLRVCLWRRIGRSGKLQIGPKRRRWRSQVPRAGLKERGRIQPVCIAFSWFGILQWRRVNTWRCSNGPRDDVLYDGTAV